MMTRLTKESKTKIIANIDKHLIKKIDLEAAVNSFKKVITDKVDMYLNNLGTDIHKINAEFLHLESLARKLNKTYGLSLSVSSHNYNSYFSYRDFCQNSSLTRQFNIDFKDRSKNLISLVDNSPYIKKHLSSLGLSFGYYDSLQLLLPEPYSTFLTNSFFSLIVEKEKLFIKDVIDAHKALAEKLNIELSDIQKTRQTSVSIVESSTTIKSLLNKWPEVKELIPEYLINPPKPNLLSTIISTKELNSTLGLPSENK